MEDINVDRVSQELLLKFEEHACLLRNRKRKRKSQLELRSHLEANRTDIEQQQQQHGPSTSASSAINVGTNDLQYGVWQDGDSWQGDVCLRTLQNLLNKIDSEGYERSVQQVEFHSAFIVACARVIYKRDWEINRPAIMQKNSWIDSKSEVMISTPRRFGKTFSVAMFCACIALACTLEVVIFSPARRASRKLLERIVQFIRTVGAGESIIEYNQEQMRCNNYQGGESLVRSFPSKVDVRAH